MIRSIARPIPFSAPRFDGLRPDLGSSVGLSCDRGLRRRLDPASRLEYDDGEAGFRHVLFPLQRRIRRCRHPFRE